MSDRENGLFKPEEYFEMLADWKKLPSYQLERRIDSLIGYYLPAYLKEKEGIDINEKNLIPEFPLRQGTIDPEKYGEDSQDKNRSKKVDFVAIANDKYYFIELKTDMNSINDKQLQYLKKAVKSGVIAIVEGVSRLRKNSNAKEKYGHLDSKIPANNNSQYELKVVFILPSLKMKYKKVLVNAEDRIKEILGIAPEIIEFTEIVEWLKGKNTGEKTAETEFAKLLEICVKDARVNNQ